MKEKIKNLESKIIIIQIIFLIIIVSILYLFYPKTGYNINGNIVKFDSINSKVIIISKNPDFSNPKYINFEKEEVFVQLEPGKYYWKPANNFIKGFKKEFEIKSEVGLAINRNETAEIKNIGNVRINISRTENGLMIGHIILEPEESQKIEDKGVYEARQK